MKVIKSNIRLYASAEAVINQFLVLPGKDRVKHIVERVKGFSEEEVSKCLSDINHDFASRHRNMEEVLLDHFNKVSLQYSNDISKFSRPRKLVLGAFFTKEYSIHTAALFNPSIVPHPNQENLSSHQQRFIMSLRATGEGHISSIIFKTGIVDDSLNISIDKNSGYYTSLKKNEQATYSKEFINNRIQFYPHFQKEVLKDLPEFFTAKQAMEIIKGNSAYGEPYTASIKVLEEMFDSNYDLNYSSHIPMMEKVIFPNAKAESMGMEDVRFVRFIDDNREVSYYGSYTAYDGKNIRTQFIETKDFDAFNIRTLYGNAVSDKGMALFPEKINGKYVMVSRQGGEMINIMFSDNLYFWDSFQTLMEPVYPWELVQLGNCGSPVKTEKGWILLTHGVGAMRTYVISAILLDLKDPAKIIGRLDKPLIKADESEREGYVPNVVYTCGLLKHNNLLVVPYAVSDSATGFVTMDVNELLDEMISKN